MYKESIIEELEKDTPDLDLIIKIVNEEKRKVRVRKMFKVEELVCKVYGVDGLDLRTPCRKRELIWARHVCYAIRRKHGESQESIAKSYKRTHGAISNAGTKSRTLLKSKDKEYTKLYNKAMALVNQINREE